MKNMKKVIVTLMATLMVVVGVAVVPNSASADNTLNIPTTVEYDNEYKIADYWEDRVAPSKEGYVFGGWYTKLNDNSYKVITEENLTTEGVDTYADAYAKFVPAYVLSVRMQLAKGAETANGTGVEETYLRVLSGVDSTNYKEVGFKVWFNKKSSTQQVATLSNVYKNISNDDGSINATEVFGEPATHFSVLKIDKIASKNYEKVIYVTPFWTTMDGTRVEGQAKYVRVMDGYAKNHYISVPVNLTEGSDVAAGRLQMKYDQTKLEYVGFDAGVLLPEMVVNANQTTGNISFVANGTETGVNVNPAEHVYANVWFKKVTNETSHLKFDIKNLEFCNWDEAIINNVKAWDIKY